jgi:uncharacterized protein (TIGR02145 family)
MYQFLKSKITIILFAITLTALISCLKDYDNPIDTANDWSIPPAPQNFNLIEVDGQTKVLGTFFYEYINAFGVIYERSPKGENRFLAIDTVNGNETFIDSINLSELTEYDYRICGYNKNGLSKYSDTVSISTGVGSEGSSDKTGPSITIKDGIDPVGEYKTIATDGITLNGSITDPAGVTSFVVSLNGGKDIDLLDSTTWSYDFNFTDYTNKLLFTATDSINNISLDSFTVYCNVVNTPLKVTSSKVDNKVVWTWPKCLDIDFKAYVIWSKVDTTLDTTMLPVDTIYERETLSYMQNIISDTSIYWFMISVLDSIGEQNTPILNQHAQLQVMDIDGNKYQTQQIGNQIWTIDNLKTTKYNDGTTILKITNDDQWGRDENGAYCYYDNDSIKNADVYGALYNWYAVNTGKLAPLGWHVPDREEWAELESFLIADGHNWDGSKTGNKLGKSMAAKDTWDYSSTDGHVGNSVETNNSSGFTAIPGGSRYLTGQSFDNKGSKSNWWGTTENYSYHLIYDYEDAITSENDYYNFGYSIRLVKD